MEIYMLRNFFRLMFLLFLTTGLWSLSLVSQADWKETVGNLWEETKTKSVELTEKAEDMAKDLRDKFTPEDPVEIGIAYGTEKKDWLEWAVTEFGKTEHGKNIKITLIPMGSVEGAKAVLEQDKRIQVWSPASSLIQSLLVEPWQKEHNKDPILSDAPLVLTPMVIVMWADRFEAFKAKYNEVSFKSIVSAATEKTGWTAIADKPDWGLFTFGYTKPTYSNSGLMALVLMAYDYAGLSRDVKPEHVMDEGFIGWLKTAQESLSSEEESTNKLMDSMLRHGPSQLNGVFVYENLALTSLKTAENRWGKLKIIYPTRSVWNDNPFFILDVPWSSEEQRQAAKIFQQFLLSADAQKVARDKFLFRPASLELPITGEGSAFDALQDVVKTDVATIKRPSAEVLNQLIQLWKRNSE
jgi:Ca-activated chloride channel family protein